jgi:hypothetical protein
MAMTNTTTNTTKSEERWFSQEEKVVVFTSDDKTQLYLAIIQPVPEYVPISQTYILEGGGMELPEGAYDLTPSQSIQVKLQLDWQWPKYCIEIFNTNKLKRRLAIFPKKVMDITFLTKTKAFTIHTNQNQGVELLYRLLSDYRPSLKNLLTIFE